MYLPVGDIDVPSRLAVYPVLPPGGKYELVLDGAEHSAFTDRPLPGDRETRNPNHHRVILALNTAFWDANCATTSRPRRGWTATAQARCLNRMTAGNTNRLVKWRHPCGRYQSRATTPSASGSTPTL